MRGAIKMKIEQKNDLGETILARSTEDGQRKQTLRKHMLNVADFAYAFGKKCGLGDFMRTAGFCHDLGKSSAKWQEYFEKKIRKEKVKTIQHSVFGSKYAYDISIDCLPIAEILGNIIVSHHDRLYDNISPDGLTPLTDKLSEGAKFSSPIELDVDINVLSNEFMRVINLADKGEKSFFISMLTKFAFSCLVDADRFDAYLFESIEGDYSIEDYLPKTPNWGEFLSKLEQKLLEFSASAPKSEMEESMAKLRQKVSEDCFAAGSRDIGIYKLEVPTGGGKTLASLRFALEHAKTHGLDRIIYVAPYLTILSQTAKEIREKLGADEDVIVEHHSNFMADNPDDPDNLENEKKYKFHTDRWDSPIILTTQVQILESIFSAKAGDLRKFHNMANSVIIFDEAQSIPIKCIHLFNTAMNFLNRVCKSTILLCTATQPPFEAVYKKMAFSKNPSLTQFIETPKRYHINYDTLTFAGYTYPELAKFVMEKHQNSTLVIVNTKSAAKGLYEELKKNGAPVLHLSTNMCSAHRDEVIAELRRRLDKNTKEPVICVSTQLIEAGVDISFECVIRDIAGLDSIYQAAGRCNRHGEFDGVKNVYVVNVKDENLSKLPDIKKGAEITQQLFDEKDLDINQYYKNYFSVKENEMNYRIDGGSVYDLLTYNKQGCAVFENRGNKSKVELRSAIRSAADEFYIIDKGRLDIIVPYKERDELLKSFNKTDDLKIKQILLRKLGKYSVSLYKHEVDALKGRGALDDQNYGGLTVLRGFYDEEIGIKLDGNHEFITG